MLHSDQSCPDIPVRLDSRIGIDPGERKIGNKSIKKPACCLVSIFFQLRVNTLWLQTNMTQRHLQFSNIVLLTSTEKQFKLQQMKIDTQLKQ